MSTTYNYFSGDIKHLSEDEVFVFGSNLAGAHGSGAARVARDLFGAVLGVGVGMTGQCYALPTKDLKINTLPLLNVEGHVVDFLIYAALNPEKTFIVTQIGCGLAGYTPAQIAPMFRGASLNCHFDSAWQEYLE